MPTRQALTQRRAVPEGSNAHDLAFLMMLNIGLDPSVACDAGTDQYHGVVREAGAFLSKRPDSSTEQT